MDSERNRNFAARRPPAALQRFVTEKKLEKIRKKKRRMNFQELISGFSGCSPLAHSDYFENTGSMNGFEDVSRDHFPLRSPELDGMETGSALPAAANSAVAAAPQPTPTPIPIAQVSQPPVSKRDIVKLQTRMEELALRVASIYSEPWKDFMIKQDILDSLDDLEERKYILEEKIASLQRMLDSKTAPAAPGFIG